MRDGDYWKQRNLPVRLTKRESDLQRTILGYLDLKRIFHFRSNTGAIKFSRPDGKGRFVRFGVRGQADILCCIKGQFVAIECKAEDGEQTLAQKEWQAGLEHAGGFYILARKLEDVEKVINDNHSSL